MWRYSSRNSWHQATKNINAVGGDWSILFDRNNSFHIFWCYSLVSLTQYWGCLVSFRNFDWFHIISQICWQIRFRAIRLFWIFMKSFWKAYKTETWKIMMYPFIFIFQKVSIVSYRRLAVISIYHIILFFGSFDFLLSMLKASYFQ